MSYIDVNGKEYETMDEVIQANYDDMVAEIESNNGEQLEAAKWIKDGDDFIPAPKIEVCDSAPSNIYKIITEGQDTKISPVKLNTDELFTFSEDYTSSILDEVQNFWDRRETYLKHNVTHKRGILLCGAPGCGKTSIINLLTNQLKEKGGLIFMISSYRDFDIYCALLKPIIRKIEPERPIITIIEDVNQIICEMGGDYRILDFMDGRNSIDNHLVILTANDTRDLSDALLRPSRIDLTYEIENPSERVRKEYFEKKGIPADLVTEYAAATEGFSFAELKEVFIGTQVLGKELGPVVEQITAPFECKDYLNKTHQIKGIE